MADISDQITVQKVGETKKTNNVLDDIPAVLPTDLPENCSECGMCCMCQPLYIIESEQDLQRHCSILFRLRGIRVRCVDGKVYACTSHCYALDSKTHKCSIYSGRPDECRLFQRGSLLCRTMVYFNRDEWCEK